MSAKSLFSFVFSGAAVFAATVFFGALAPTPARAACYDVPDGTGGTQLYCGPDVIRPQPTTAPPAHYAAIYYDDVTRAFGTAWGKSSEAEANQAALQSCRAYGGRNCQWAASGPHACFALAISSRGDWAPAFGDYPETAKAKAISACRKNGGTDCQVPAAAHPCSED